MHMNMGGPSEDMAQSETLRFDLPASHKYLDVLGACVHALITHVNSADEATLSYTVQLAVHEACTNIINHAYAGSTAGRIGITMTLDVNASPIRLVVEIHDTGNAFDPSSIQPPKLDEPQEHGYGVFLMHQLMDQVTYRSGADGNYCTLTKHLA